MTHKFPFVKIPAGTFSHPLAFIKMVEDKQWGDAFIPYQVLVGSPFFFLLFLLKSVSKWSVRKVVFFHINVNRYNSHVLRLYTWLYFVNPWIGNRFLFHCFLLSCNSSTNYKQLMQIEFIFLTGNAIQRKRFLVGWLIIFSAVMLARNKLLSGCLEQFSQKTKPSSPWRSSRVPTYHQEKLILGFNFMTL